MRGFDNSAIVLAAIEAPRVTCLTRARDRIALVARVLKSNILNDRHLTACLL
jgi:hypothetical protein